MDLTKYFTKKKNLLILSIFLCLGLLWGGYCIFHSKNRSPAQLVQGEPFDCPNDIQKTGVYVFVPGDPNLGTNGFCVMKYEAKHKGHFSIFKWKDKPVSMKIGLPWTDINAIEAQKKCESIKLDNYPGIFSLISNPEWMTIARNIEKTPTNWSGGDVRKGIIPRGNSGYPSISFNVLSVPDNNDPYLQTGGSVSSKIGSGWEQKRVHQITSNNGSYEIWDFAGNVKEWADWDPYTPGYTTGPVDVHPQGTHFAPDSAQSFLGSLIDKDILPLYSHKLPFYRGILFYGRVQGGPGGAAIRGGGHRDHIKAGIFSLNLQYNSEYKSKEDLGFRCVYRP